MRKKTLAALPVILLVVSYRIDAMQRSPAFFRNRDIILEALKTSGLAKCERILEIGSGPGEHAPYFASQLGAQSPIFQPTDMHSEDLASSDAHAKAAGVFESKVLAARPLDIFYENWGFSAFDGCLCINVLHIAPHAAIPHFFRGVSNALEPGGLCGIYDTWKIDGNFVGPNNQGFHFGLRAQGFSGIPTIEECDHAAQQHNMHRTHLLYLPANNQFAVYRKLQDSEAPPTV